jgi:transposase-like protein
MLAGLTTDFFWYGKRRTREVAKADGVLVVEVAKHYRESRNSVYAWLRRHREEGLPGLVDQSHYAHQYPGRSAIEFEALAGLLFH